MKSYPENFAKLVESLEKLPSIGRKSAMRLAYFLAFEDKFSALSLAHNIECCVQQLRVCEECGGISNDTICAICSDKTRNNGELCVVANPREIFLLEESGEFLGKYFVVESLERLDLKHLEQIIRKRQIREVIFAFSPTLGSESVML